MFTGIIESLGTVVSIQTSSKSIRLCINSAFDEPLVMGESIAVNGVCLTVAKIENMSFYSDITPETFSCTTLGQLKKGSRVNLERAMKANGRFGGHIVSGHIDGKGIIESITAFENSIDLAVSADKAQGKYFIYKGSVAVEGISLTIAKVQPSSGRIVFHVAVIPHTFENTILKYKKPGDSVNLESDMIAKYIEHFTAKPEKTAEVDWDFESFHNQEGNNE